MGGGIDSTLTRIATDLTSVIPADTVRVIPVIGRGPLQNIGDLIRLPNVDLALVSVDALAYASQRRLYPQLDKIAYIAKLFESDVHVCARPEIRSLNDLEGKAVNIDVAGSGTDLTARAVFAALEIKPDFRNEEPTIAQTKLRNGALAANVYLEGKPVPLFVNTPPGTGLHFLTVLSNPMLDQAYVPGGEFTHEDYPTLIAPDEFVETLGVSVVMAAFNWPPNTVRNRNLTVFTQQFFQHFPELLTPPHHPKWHDVNLAADLPGWPRFPPATAQLASVVAGSTEAAHTRFIAQFNAWLEQNGGASMTAAQRQAMLQAFASILVGKP
jgi:TRAP-type uncharacterized transport system substrate-binding protein